jgi:hypothetical protein
MTQIVKSGVWTVPRQADIRNGNRPTMVMGVIIKIHSCGSQEHQSNNQFIKSWFSFVEKKIQLTSHETMGVFFTRSFIKTVPGSLRGFEITGTNGSLILSSKRKPTQHSSESGMFYKLEPAVL